MRFHLRRFIENYQHLGAAARRGKIIQGTACAPVEKRQIALDTREVRGLRKPRDIALDGFAQTLDSIPQNRIVDTLLFLHLRDTPRQQFAKGITRLCHGLTGIGNLVRGDKSDRLYLIGTHLCLAVKHADRFHIVAEQVDTDRRLGIAGKHIENIAASCKRAGQIDLILAAIAKSGQASGDGVQIERIADLYRDTSVLDCGRRRRLLQQSRDRRNQSRKRFAIRQGNQRGKTSPCPAHISPTLLIIEQERQGRRQNTHRLRGLL